MGFIWVNKANLLGSRDPAKPFVGYACFQGAALVGQIGYSKKG